MLFMRGVSHTAESASTSSTGMSSLVASALARREPIAIIDVASASASMAVGATTVALSTSVRAGRPVAAEIVWP